MSAASQVVWLGAGDLCRVCPGAVGLPWMSAGVVATGLPVGDGAGGAALTDVVGEGSESALCSGDPPGFVPRVSVWWSAAPAVDGPVA